MTLTSTELGLFVAGIGLAGVILGGMVSGLFAILTGWLSGRRERAHWLRGQRISTYSEFLRLVGLTSKRKAASEGEAWPQQFEEALVRITILGPIEVLKCASVLAGSALVVAVNTADPDDSLEADWPGPSEDVVRSLATARAAYSRACQKALGIKVMKGKKKHHLAGQGSEVARGSANESD